MARRSGLPIAQRSLSSAGVQQRAMVDGIAGIPGIYGNVDSVSYRIQRKPESPNPTLSAK